VAGSCEYGKELFVFHERLVISWTAERLLASEEGF